MAQRRILWLDQLKAVGFFLVILGHMDIPGALNGWIYSFHMPLFFLVSGFTLNLKKTAEAPLRAQVPKLLKRMVLPYVWIELICLCFSFLNTVLLQGKELHLARNLLVAGRNLKGVEFYGVFLRVGRVDIFSGEYVAE